MHIEYYNINTESKDIDYKNDIDQIVSLPISSILGNIHLIKYVQKNYKNLNCELGCFIDYPLGANSLNYRTLLIDEAINTTGCDFVVIPIPFYYVINRRYDKFRSDIKNNIELCNSNNTKIRYMLEYRKFDHQLLTKVCKILMENTIDVVYGSTGFFIDNVTDHLIASNYLNSKTGIKTIINANIWKKEQINEIYKNQIYGISLTNIECFKNIHPKLYDKK